MANKINELNFFKKLKMGGKYIKAISDIKRTKNDAERNKKYENLLDVVTDEFFKARRTQSNKEAIIYQGVLQYLQSDKFKKEFNITESKLQEKTLSVPEKHQKKIALQTLKYSDAGAKIMGGMTKDEAKKFLKSIGYTDRQIKKLEESSLNETKWEYIDNRGKKQTGDFVKFLDHGGTDVTYFFKNSKTGKVDVISGSRLKKAKPIKESKLNESDLRMAIRTMIEQELDQFDIEDEEKDKCDIDECEIECAECEKNETCDKHKKNEEEELDEVSTTGDIAGYQTPYAFAGKDKERTKQISQQLGYKLVGEPEDRDWDDIVNARKEPLVSRKKFGEVKEMNEGRLDLKELKEASQTALQDFMEMDGKPSFTGKRNVPQRLKLLKKMAEGLGFEIVVDPLKATDELRLIDEAKNYTIVAIKNNKVVDQFHTTDKKEIDDVISVMKKDNKGAKISVEDPGGKVIKVVNEAKKLRAFIGPQTKGASARSNEYTPVTNKQIKKKHPEKTATTGEKYIPIDVEVGGKIQKRYLHLDKKGKPETMVEGVGDKEGIIKEEIGSEVKDEVIALLKSYGGKEIPDSEIHAVAEKHGISPDKLESYIYSLASAHVNEGRRGVYQNYRDDGDMTTRQKIGESLRNVRNQLSEIEKTIDLNLRLKQETGINSQEYWKRTHRALNRINERMTRIINKIRRF
jgi:hypothetical protein